MHFYNNVTSLCGYADNILISNEADDTSALLSVMY